MSLKKQKELAFAAVILEDHRVTIPSNIAKIKKVKKGKMFWITIGEEVDNV